MNPVDPSQTTSWNDTQKLLAFIVVGAFVLFLAGWTFYPPKGVDQSILTVINVLLGALVAKFSSVIDYYFGSSRGERNKDAATTAATVAAAAVATNGNGHGPVSPPVAPATPVLPVAPPAG